MRKLTAALAFASIGAFASAAHADNYEIDGQHAWVTFTIKHGIYGIAHGQFDARQGRHRDGQGRSVEEQRQGRARCRLGAHRL